jgi:hypothetical protein
MPKRVLALDITDDEIKAAVLETSFRDYRVAGLYQEPLSIANGSKEDQIRRFVERHDLAADTVLSGLPGDCVTWRMFFLPFRDRKRLLQTIPFELESQVPFGLDEVVIDHHVVGRDRSGTTVLAALVPKRDLERHLELLGAVGLDPKVVDLSPLAALNTLSLVSDLPPTHVFIDFDGPYCTVALRRNGELVGLRCLTLAAPSADGNGAAAPGIEASQAAPINGSAVESSANGGSAEEQPSFAPVAMPLLAQIRWTLLALNGAPLDEGMPCYAAGDASHLAGVERELEEHLGMKVHRIERLPLRGLEPGAGRQVSAFASSLGLALREVVPSNLAGVNFRRGEFAYHRAEQELRRQARATVALGAVVIALMVVGLYVDYWYKARQVTLIDARIREVVEATLPDVRITAPRAQLQEEIGALQQRLALLHSVIPASGSAGVDIMRAISAAVPTKIRVDSDEYTLDPDAVRLRANTDTFESVDAIKHQLLDSGYFSEVDVRDVKTAKNGAGVDFRLRLVLSKDVHLRERGP